MDKFTYPDTSGLNSKPTTPRPPALQFDLAEDGDLSIISSPFNDSKALKPPSTPLVRMFSGKDLANMKRLRWGTTRTKTGRPKNENLGRNKTLRRVFRRHDASKSEDQDEELDVIEKYASQDDSSSSPESDLTPANDRRGETRTVVFNRTLPEHMMDADSGLPITEYPRNKIRTAKFTALSFFPKTIWGQFLHNIANNYFLFLLILGAFPIFGVPSPGMAAVPLIVIVCMTALKDSFEDSQRTAQDMEVNNQPTHILTQAADSTSSFIYTNPNVSDDSISLWRRFKKWNTKILFKFIRFVKANFTKTGRANKARAHAQEERREAQLKRRSSLDSVVDFRRSSIAPSRKSMQSLPGQRTLHFAKKTWKEVKVGDIVRINNNEEIPADILLLSSSDEDNCCYVETKNLDGETNLKIKQAMSFTTDPKKIHRADNLMDFNFEIESEGPHPNLYSYEGAAIFESQGEVQREPATINNLLLRGCNLRNTKWAIGIVLFTGFETKIMLNAGITPSKTSRISRELNYYVIVNFVILFLICFATGLFSGLDYRRTATSREYFEFGTIAGSPAMNGLVNFFVGVILYQALVPISLYITIEIIKTFQAYFIHCDIGLYYEKLDFPCNPRAWSISDDLGQIEYIFSDKTGTLTQNLMEFRKCTINGKTYGRAYTEALAGLRSRQGFNVEEEARVEKELIAKERIEMMSELKSISQNIYDEESTMVSRELVSDLKGTSGDIQKARNEEFLLCLALCHSVVVEENPKDPNKMLLKAQSPDEAALVGTARSLGFVFADKTKKGYILRVQGEKREYQILNTLEFNSTRKRMSAIVKFPSVDGLGDPKVVLYCKGADSIIYLRLAKSNDEQMLETTSKHLEEYATEGLRTLCIAKRELLWSEYQAWNQKYLAASSSLTDRDAKVEAAADEIERGLILLGGTAIEDRLQDGVPESISTLSQAGIKLWVLTGDKVETAINIGFSCNLLGNDMDLLVLKTDILEEEAKRYDVIPGDDGEMIIEKLLTWYLREHFNMTGSQEDLEEAMDDHSAPNERFGVVIDGDALKLALNDADIRRKFLLLCKQSKAVLCCRVSPAQKAAVVKMVKDTLDVMTLAIGDGSNDVAMIQAADVGVGITGEEGRQAAMSSDYALGQFRFLTRLLLTHGRWSYKRFAEMIPCFFYKNVNYTMALFWYNIFNNFDGSYLFEFTFIMFYNLAFTSLPVIFLAVFDQDVSAKVSMLTPQLYRAGIMRTEFTERAFWIYVIDGFYQSLVAFFFPYWVYCQSFQVETGKGADHRFFVGILVTCISCFAANFYVWIHQYRWDYVSFLAIMFSVLIVFFWTGVWTSSTWSSEAYQAGRILLGLAMYWACLFVGTLVSLLPRLFYDIIQKLYFPTDSDIIRECALRGEFDQYPETYDPTDPKRNIPGKLSSDLEGTVSSESFDESPFKEVPRRPAGNTRQDVREENLQSYYHDNSSIIDTYNVYRTSTDLNKLESMEDMTHVMTTEQARRRLGVRTSLEMVELTTRNSLHEAQLK